MGRLPRIDIPSSFPLFYGNLNLHAVDFVHPLPFLCPGINTTRAAAHPPARPAGTAAAGVHSRLFNRLDYKIRVYINKDF